MLIAQTKKEGGKGGWLKQEKEVFEAADYQLLNSFLSFS